MSRRVHLAFALVAVALVAMTSGCFPPSPPLLSALTSPPPFAQADLCYGCDGTSDVTLTLTQGVALAFTCSDPTTGDTCSGIQAVMQDPTVASVRDAYLVGLSDPEVNVDQPGIDGAEPEGVLVVIGLHMGETTLAFSSDSGDASIQVSVVAF